MSWSMVEKVLDEAGKHSTWLGKIWIISLFFFRILVLIRIADTVYSDEQSNFRCNHRQPGCENVCFSEYSPFSFTRFTAFQIIVVALPTIVYILYAAHMVAMNRQLNPTGTQANILRCKMDRRQIQLQSQGLGLTLAERTKLKQQRAKSSLPKSSKNVISGTVSKFNSFLPKSEPPPYRTHPNSSFSSQTTGFFNKIKGKLNPMNEDNFNSQKDDSGSETTISARSDIYHFDEYVQKPRKRKTKKNKHQKKYLKNHASNVDRITLDAKLLKNRLSKAYAIHALIRCILEVIMTTIQYKTFPWIVSPLYKCNLWPCPNVVDCFISRPREKTYITQFLMCTSFFCVFINFLDLHWIGVKRIRKAFNFKTKKDTPSGKLVSANDVLRMARAGGVEALAQVTDNQNSLAKNKNKFFKLQCHADKEYKN